MEVVRNITGVNFPVLTPNLKVSYFTIKRIFLLLVYPVITCSAHLSSGI
jgi:hypothetical protein